MLARPRGATAAVLPPPPVRVPDLLRDQLQTSLGTAYTLERELGGGGMSHVFVATDSRLEHQVVVKALSPPLAAGPSAERTPAELRTMRPYPLPHGDARCRRLAEMNR
jgi:serine/threonine-protein kinase